MAEIVRPHDGGESGAGAGQEYRVRDDAVTFNQTRGATEKFVIVFFFFFFLV